MTETIALKDLMDLIKLKKDNPIEYKQLLKDMEDVTNDLMIVAKKVIDNVE